MRIVALWLVERVFIFILRWCVKDLLVRMFMSLKCVCPKYLTSREDLRYLLVSSLEYNSQWYIKLSSPLFKLHNSSRSVNKILIWVLSVLFPLHSVFCVEREKGDYSARDCWLCDLAICHLTVLMDVCMRPHLYYIICLYLLMMSRAPQKK